MSTTMFTEAMITPCGLDCSLCKRALADEDPVLGGDPKARNPLKNIAVSAFFPALPLSEICP